MSPAQDPFSNAALLATMSASLLALARQGELRSFRRRALLITEGDQGDTLYIVLAGRVRAFCSSADGSREISFNAYGPGEYVGEMGLDGGPRSASVVAEENTLCAMVTRATLMRHLAQDPQFAFELLAKVIRRARTATLHARTIAFNGVYGQLKALLEEQARPQPDGRLRVPVRMTHREMANRFGCTREMVTRVMKELQPHYLHIGDDGLIELLRPLPAKF